MKTYKIICKNCKKEFTAHRSDKVFCKTKCKFDYWKLFRNELKYGTK